MDAVPDGEGGAAQAGEEVSRELIAGNRTWQLEELERLVDDARKRPDTIEFGDVLEALLRKAGVARPVPANDDTKKRLVEAMATQAVARARLRDVRTRLSRLVTTEQGARQALVQAIDDIIAEMR